MRVMGAGKANGGKAGGPRWQKALKGGFLAAAMAALVLPGTTSAQDSGVLAVGATFYSGADFTGQSKTLTLAADQPYQAIPFIGDELNEKIGSLKLDPQLGLILFQRPYFASRDDSCGLNLGTRENPRSWWRGRTADFEPPFALPSGQPYETPEMQDQDYSSVIAYRRDLGPPPGFLLLERRSYYNRACERSDEQNYFNRIFIPVPNPPKREACVDLSLPATSVGAGADAPQFVRVTEALALLPESFDPRFRGADHRFIATIFAAPGCSGPSITLTSSERGAPARYKLKDFDFDRRAKSVLIRYQRGPLDRYLEVPSAVSEAPSEAPAPAVIPAPAPAQVQAPAQAAAPAPAQAPAQARVPAPTEAPVPAPVQPPVAAPAPVQAPAPAPASAPESSATAQTPVQPAAAAPISPAPASPASPSLQPQAPVPAPPAPEPATGGLQPAPPSAPPPQQQQVLQPVLEPEPEPQPQAAPAVPVVPRAPSGPQEQTFRFPVHQVYRLNFCVNGDQGCGDPAANAWCQNKGFNQAARWSREDNIGALYPTVFIGSGTICDKFLCDGFEEITCTR